MKPYSITRRLVTTVLLVELLLTGCATAVSLLYERNQQLRSFDVMLRGRADSMLAAVQDSEDAQDNVVLETAGLDLPKSDLYDVREESGRPLGRSSNWNGADPAQMGQTKPFLNLTEGGKRYRGIVLHGVRMVDVEGAGPGIARRVVVFYAIPTRRVTRELWEAARFLTLFNSLLLLITGAVLILLLRRGMAPLNALAARAAEVTAQHWRFEAPPEARGARELKSLVEALEAVLSRLERSFQQQRNFVNDAAHELKTAVTVVKSSLQLVNYKDRSVQEYREGLNLCLTDCERMEDLVQRLLTLARFDQLDAGRGQGLPSQSDVADCLRGVVAQLEPVAAVGGVAVVVELPESLEAAIQEEDFVTLATNLLLNAIQHSGAGAQVLLSAGTGDSTGVRIAVRDEGEGIPAEHLPFVFERFYRGDASRSRQTGGTGLGLAICHAIVEAYGGRISIESAERKGTMVTVDLPAPVAGIVASAAIVAGN